VDIGELVDAPVEEILDVVETSKEVEEETPESVGTKPTLFFQKHHQKKMI